MVQVICRRRLLTAEAWARYHFSPYEICGGQSGFETGSEFLGEILPMLHIHSFTHSFIQYSPINCELR